MLAIVHFPTGSNGHKAFQLIRAADDTHMGTVLWPHAPAGGRSSFVAARDEVDPDHSGGIDVALV
jgi:hypothetical protein